MCWHIISLLYSPAVLFTIFIFSFNKGESSSVFFFVLNHWKGLNPLQTSAVISVFDVFRTERSDWDLWGPLLNIISCVAHTEPCFYMSSYSCYTHCVSVSEHSGCLRSGWTWRPAALHLLRAAAFTSEVWGSLGGQRRQNPVGHHWWQHRCLLSTSDFQRAGSELSSSVHRGKLLCPPEEDLDIRQQFVQVHHPTDGLQGHRGHCVRLVALRLLPQLSVLVSLWSNKTSRQA